MKNVAPNPMPIVWLIEDHADSRQVLARVLNRSGNLLCPSAFVSCEKGGIVIVNTEKVPDYKVPDGVKLITIDATTIALKAIGLPITNTSLMGAFAAASGEIKFSALEKALNHRFPKDLAIKNIEAARQAYTKVKGGA